MRPSKDTELIKGLSVAKMSWIEVEEAHESSCDEGAEKQHFRYSEVDKDDNLHSSLLHPKP